MAEGTGLDAFASGLDTPMFVVTTVRWDTGERAGCLVGFASQCSIDPPRFAVYVSRSNHTHRVALAADLVAVHGLSAAQRDLAELFGTRTGDEIDKFGRCRWLPGPGGVPLLPDCPRWFVGRILDRAPWGDHTGFLLEPVSAAGEPSPAPLMYSAVADLRAGHPA